MQKSFLLVGRVVVACFQIEDTCIYRGTFQPIGDRNHLLVVETQIMFVIKWVDSLYCFEQT